MFQNLDIFKMASGMARHAISRQEVVAKNIANADTPEYRAKDIASFEDTYRADTSNTSLRATRAGHVLESQQNTSDYRLIDTPGASSPNGNTVSLEGEMMKSAQVRHEHDMALAVYKSSMNILRTSLGRK
ncbi:FlgB family protein [Celeribacter neptunius]|uniref:Flagellar basal body rod protein FlgB n=1 Tax=Celeribacter neptunius TaxID=588602 RepID=A0A1I3STZ0_9RHOB|nr:FlgB family protein [Celeribacter neptunius]SFJ61692.1 flagellar basal-body rod protein FlgB [Celeribacter neptunius]